MKKNPVCETVVWPLADRVKNLIEKEWPGLSDSGMASGGLKKTQSDRPGDGHWGLLNSYGHWWVNISEIKAKNVFSASFFMVNFRFKSIVKF